jgi:hypothetical protein
MDIWKSRLGIVIIYYLNFQMTGIKVTANRVKELCSEQTEIKEAHNEDGSLRYVKLLTIAKIDELGISECLECNKALLGDLEDYVFPQHFLRIEEEITSKTITGLVTRPYETTLDRYVKKHKLSEKQALVIFEHIVKAIYSLYQSGFATRNLRSSHFVLCNGVWKIESLVYSDDYHQAGGAESEYLWNPRYQAP